MLFLGPGSTRVLQVKADGSLINDLDLFHHRPYECIILGQCHGEVSLQIFFIFIIYLFFLTSSVL